MSSAPAATTTFSPTAPPAAVPMPATDQALTQAEANALAIRHLGIWSQQDEAKRNVLLLQTYASDMEMVEPSLVLSGFGKLNEFLNSLLHENPGFTFTLAKPVVAHHNLVCLYWHFGPASNSKAATGTDLFVVENGKVQKLYVFVDEPQPAQE